MMGLAEKTAETYTGTERRRSPRLQASYPVRVRFINSTGDIIERFSHTRNVSSRGLLIVAADAPEVGTNVDVSVAIPAGSNAVLPEAQLDVAAVVLRSEAVDHEANDGYSRQFALHFIETPSVSPHLSMFD
jgi:hypothetical protein